ncbi:TolC family protein, partial [bacterium]|nr:TolC family protein [bacterium]
MDLKLLSMEDAVNYAVSHNPRIHEKKAEVEREKAAGISAWSLPKPEFLLLYEGMPKGSNFDTWGSRKMMFGQKFEFPLKYFLKIKKQSLLVERAEYNFNLERINLVSDVKDAYIDALFTRDKLALAQENLKLSKDLMDKAKLRYEFGEAGSIDYLRAKLHKSRSENSVITEGIHYKDAMEKLVLLLTGRRTESEKVDFELTDPLKYIPVDIDRLVSEEPDILNHSLLKGADMKLKAASCELTLARSSYLPDFSVTYFKENRSNVPGFWGMQFGMSLPLWFMSDQRGRTSEAHAKVKSADWNRVHIENHLRSEYRAAFYSLREAEKQVKRFNEEILSEAGKVFELASFNYKEGETSYIDLIFAQRALIETRIEYLNTLASYN